MEQGQWVDDRYVLDERLGVAPHREVWRAKDTASCDDVVLKIVTGSYDVDHEASVLTQLDHPHIVRSRGVHHGELSYLVLEWIEGMSLRARIAKDGRLPEQTALSIARDVASALAYAHSRGIIHQDIKPGNIIVTEGHRPTKVTDFGMATLDQRVDAMGCSWSSQDDLVRGTLQYLSPEQRIHGRTITEKTDCYALGAVLYEILSGKPLAAPDELRKVGNVTGVSDRALWLVKKLVMSDPFQRRSAYEAMMFLDILLDAHRLSPRPLTQVPCSLDRTLSPGQESALQPQSTGDFWDVLKEALPHEQPHEPPEPLRTNTSTVLSAPPHVVRSSRQRPRSAYHLAAAVLLGGLTGLGMYTLDEPTTRSPSISAVEQEAQRTPPIAPFSTPVLPTQFPWQKELVRIPERWHREEDHDEERARTGTARATNCPTDEKLPTVAVQDRRFRRKTHH